MIPSRDAPLTILIDLAKTEAEKAAMAEIHARHPGALVVAAYDPDHQPACNINDCEASPEFREAQAELAKKYDVFFDDYRSANPDHALLIDGMRAPLFDHNLHELHKWLFALGRLLQDRNPQSLSLLLPAAPTSNQIVLFEAEGEVSTNARAGFLYRRTDFLLHAIRAFFTLHGLPGISHYSAGQRDWIRPFGRRLLRTYAMLALRASRHIAHRVRHTRREEACPRDDIPVLAVSRSVVHSDYLSSLVTSGIARPFVLESPFSYPKVQTGSTLLFGHAPANLYDEVSVLTIFREAVRAALTLLRVDLGMVPARLLPKFAIDGVELSLGTCLREAVTASFEYNLVAGAVRTKLTRHAQIRALAHCEMFTGYAPYLQAVCHEMNVRCYQLAFGTYDMRAAPRSLYADAFLCFSKSQHESLRAAWDGDTRIRYEGNLYINSSIQTNSDLDEIQRRVDARHILYFAQPYDESAEDRLVEYLVDLGSREGYRVTVVLHPRGRIGPPFTSKLAQHVITNTQYISSRTEIERNATIAFTRCSNIGYLLILRGVPLANVLISAYDRRVWQEYYEGYPLILNSMAQAANLILEPKEKIREFYEFRHSFVTQSYCELGAHELGLFIGGRPR